MLNITNYIDHPTRIGFTVFKFYKKERAAYFEELLKKDNIWFESSVEENNSVYLYGVKKGDFKKAMNANYLVSAKFRNKIIPNIYLRWGIIFLVLIFLTLGILGAIIRI